MHALDGAGVVLDTQRNPDNLAGEEGPGLEIEAGLGRGRTVAQQGIHAHVTALQQVAVDGSGPGIGHGQILTGGRRSSRRIVRVGEEHPNLGVVTGIDANKRCIRPVHGYRSRKGVRHGDDRGTGHLVARAINDDDQEVAADGPHPVAAVATRQAAVFGDFANYHVFVQPLSSGSRTE